MASSSTYKTSRFSEDVRRAQSNDDISRRGWGGWGRGSVGVPFRRRGGEFRMKTATTATTLASLQYHIVVNCVCFTAAAAAVSAAAAAPAAVTARGLSGHIIASDAPRTLLADRWQLRLCCQKWQQR